MAMYNSIFTGGEIDKGVGRSYVPTLLSAPTTSTLTFTLEGNTIDFEIGQQARVADQDEPLGYKFYQLYDITTSGNTKTAHWKEIKDINVVEYLTVVLTSNQTNPNSDLIGATVVIKDAEDDITLFSETWQGTALEFEIPTGTVYQVTVGAVTGYATPAAVTHTAGLNKSRTDTFTYNTTIVTVSATTNQSSHADVANVQMAVAYGQVSESVANGGTIKIPTGTEATITFPAVTGYATPSAITFTASGTTMSESGTYNTEVVTVTCTTEDNQAVTGHKVTINNVEYTLDSTGIVSAKVAYGTTYSVVLGSWSGYLTQSQSFTAGQVSRSVAMQWETMYVDLGLPSGTKWAKRYIDVTQADGFAANTYQYECSLFSWANIVGHNPVNGQSEYPFSVSDYQATPGYNLQANIADGSTTYDAARVHCGSPWKIPTKAQADELFSNTDIVDLNDNIISSGDFAVQISGVYGYLFKSKINSKKIFFPLSGYVRNSASLIEKGFRARCWYGTIIDSNMAYSTNFIKTDKGYLTYDYYRETGMAIRPVQ